MNFIENSSFEEEQNGTPKNWYVWSPRSALLPEVRVDDKVFHSGQHSFKMCGKGKPYCFVKLGQIVKGIVPGKYYRIKAYFKTARVQSVHESILVELSRLAKDSTKIRVDWADRLKIENGWKVFETVVSAPAETELLDVGLIFRWSEGCVWWDDVKLIEVSPPERRKIKVSTTRLIPPYPSTVDKNLDLFCELLDEAGRQGSDIVCLPEGINRVSIPGPLEKVAQPIPGPISRRLSQKARQYNMYVVAGIYEKVGTLIYNTGILIDRKGEIIGKYRKTHLPPEEYSRDGVAPGKDYPVFETDFGRIGILICWDMWFPEVVRILALKGAVFIFHPSMGTWSRYGNKLWFFTARSRALDNNVYIVTSMCHQPELSSSIIVSPGGEILADSGDRTGVFSAEIELIDKKPAPFYTSPKPPHQNEWRRIFPKSRRPETYGALVEYE